MKPLAIATTLVAALTLPAAATTFVRVSDETLADQAGLAVVGTVVAAAPAPGRMATDYRIRVEEPLAGAVSGQIVVRVPGGGDGPLRRRIWGAPTFQPGERTLLFLAPGAEGTWRVLHLFLGAFREVDAGGRKLAVRDLSEAQEVTISAEGQPTAAAPRAEPARDFAAFARWVRARRQGTSAPDYRLAAPAPASSRAGAKANWFRDPVDGKRMRWFDFDTAGHVGFLAYNVGQQGLSGGGYSEFQTALGAWNAETQTPIDYRYDGKTSNASGPDENAPPDDLNTIVFNDPHNLIEPFSCILGGVLAFGGPVYFTSTQSFHGEAFHKIASADIVVADGLSCFFSSSPNGSKAAQELFAHELGHTLGLDHSCGDNNSPSCSSPSLDDALMRAFVHDDARGAQLASDDRNAIRSLYQLTAPATIPAAPTGLAATATSTSQVHLTWTDNASDETAFVVEYAALGGGYQQAGGELAANTTAADVGGLAEATGYQFRVRARNTAGDSAFSNVASTATNATVAPCVDSPARMCLTHDRFAVEVAWATTDGESGAGSMIPYTDESGLVWFFSASNIELVVKVLDACPTPTPRFWVFFGGTTDVEMVLTFIDSQTGKVKAYYNPPGHLASSVIDVEAFATCP